MKGVGEVVEEGGEGYQRSVGNSDLKGSKAGFNELGNRKDLERRGDTCSLDNWRAWLHTYCGKMLRTRDAAEI